MLQTRLQNFFFAFFIGGLSFSLAAQSDTVFLEPCTGKGLDEQTREVLCDLGEDAIVSSGNKLAKDAKSAEYSLRLKALKLGTSYTITAGKYEGGNMVGSSKLKASSLDEFDSIVPRVVRAVIHNEPDAKVDAKVGEVSEEEQTFRKKRMEAKNQYIIGAGFGGSRNLNADLAHYELLLGWSIDWTSFRLRIEWNNAWEMGAGDSFLMTFGFGGNIYLNDHQSAPYIAPKISYMLMRPNRPTQGLLDFDMHEAPGLGVAVGWEFFRNFDRSAAVEAFVDASTRSVAGVGNPISCGLRALAFL
jgi:hypothetical protein